MLGKKILENLYLRKNKSMQEIANNLGYSLHKVAYWMNKYNIISRSRSEASYIKHNPKGDPFKFHNPVTIAECKLMALGLGLYWGEGTKANKTAIRLGNTDPNLIINFINFLVKICGVNKKDLKFGLQIFSDMKSNEAMKFWQEKLKVQTSQFQKVIITPSRGAGTYKKKTKYGVLTVNYNNTKLRYIIENELEKLGYEKT